MRVFCLWDKNKNPMLKKPWLIHEKCTYSQSQWFNYAEIGLQISGMCCIAGAPGPTHIYAIAFVFAQLGLPPPYIIICPYKIT